MADHRTEAAQAMPSLAAIVMWASGKDINFWVGVGGLLFLGLQCAYLIWRWRRDLRREQRALEPTDEQD